MKKLWIVLLSVALIMAFAMPVCAADVKFSGSYVAQGYYDNNRALAQRDSDGTNYGPSLSNIWQRLRVQTDFKVQEGLMLTTRFDAMEKIWGAARSLTPTAIDSSGNNNESENIKMELAYVTFNVPFGLFKVGYQVQTAFGTAFGDSADVTYGPRIRYELTTGPWTFAAVYDKVEGNKNYNSNGPSPYSAVSISSTGGYTYAANTAAQVDADREKYQLLGIYKWATGEVGLLLKYEQDTTKSGASVTTPYDNGYKSQWLVANPYFKARTGSVYTEGEFFYVGGKDRKYESPAAGVNDVDRQGYSLYLMGQVDLAPAYVGASVFWISGTDVTKTDKNTAGQTGGTDFNPCLILYNYDLARWNGPLGGLAGASGQGSSTITYDLNATQKGLAFTPGARAGQIFGGIKPIPKLDVRASITMAKADQTPAGIDSDMGKELDLTATYKIYDNLQYMVGFGYLWTGDMFKMGGTAVNGMYNKVDNDYLVTHKLTLTF